MKQVLRLDSDVTRDEKAFELIMLFVKERGARSSNKTFDGCTEPLGRVLLQTSTASILYSVEYMYKDETLFAAYRHIYLSQWPVKWQERFYNKAVEMLLAHDLSARRFTVKTVEGSSS